MFIDLIIVFANGRNEKLRLLVAEINGQCSLYVTDFILCVNIRCRLTKDSNYWLGTKNQQWPADAREEFLCALTKKPSSSGWLVVHGQLIQSLGSHNTKKWTIKWSGSSVMTHIIYNITLKFMWSFSVPWCSKIILPYCQAKYHFVLLLWNKILKWM
jgi:hypothetical protein